MFSRFFVGRHQFLAALLGSVLLLCTVAGGSAQQTRPLVAGGTGSGLEIIRILASAYGQSAPDSAITVLPSLGSGGGIKAVLKGKLNFSVSARALKDEEEAAGAAAIEFARTPMVFLTRTDNPAEEVDLLLLTSVYTGDPVFWPNGMPVRAVMRPLKEGDTKFLRALSAEIDQGIVELVSQEKAYVATNDQQNADALERVAGSLGFASYGQIKSEKRGLKPLAFNGGGNAMARLKAGDYPFVKTLRLVTAGQQDPAVSAFFDFVRSDEGAKVLEANGFLASGSPASR